MKTKYFIEMTDTFGGEANYCWVNRFLVSASSFQGAMSMISREVGYRTRKVMDCGDFARYDAKGAHICFFVNYADDESEKYARVKTLGVAA